MSPGRILHLGRLRVDWGTETPLLARRRHIVATFRHRSIPRARIRRPHLHPFFQIRDLRVRQLLLGRHLEILIIITHAFDQHALIRIVRHDDRSINAALTQTFACIQQQRALHLFAAGAMALVAVIGQKGADFRLKKGRPLGLHPGVATRGPVPHSGRDCKIESQPRPLVLA